ncbi:Bidirectional sugar transporter SWEET16 [Hibiscus syriacus]|uniref:Bidirectional sugar transporter SWEET16 n=1 Tax=Hibiscus syriacus TaxID=106335 RepID=A0A6A2WKF6_HIBSY|nr:Bidirectional sugar transporter SWEET16 [Hibiscus syriacus]
MSSSGFASFRVEAGLQPFDPVSPLAFACDYEIKNILVGGEEESTENYKAVPYITTLLSTSLWTFYGFINPDGLLIITVNGAGAMLQLTYVILFLIYAPKDKKVLALKVKTAKLVAVLDVGFLGAVIAVTLLAIHGNMRLAFVGILCAALTIGMYASPLSVMGTVIKTKSVKYMPFLLSFFLLLNAGVWSAYAVLVKDVYIGVPNAIGFILGLAQLILYVMYKNKSAAQQPDEAMEEGSAHLMKGGIEMHSLEENLHNRSLNKGKSLPKPLRLWQHLRDFKESVGDSPWLVARDSNIVVSREESSGSVDRALAHDIDVFTLCTSSIGLIDHVYSGPVFTWSNKQDDSFLDHKLDRVMVNVSWLTSFPRARVEFHAPNLSDHCSGLVSSDKEESRAREYSNAAKDQLQKNITRDEIKAAMFAQASDKAPDPDGYTSHFFKVAWDIVGEDLVQGVVYFFEHGVLCPIINATTLVLIPKRLNPSHEGVSIYFLVHSAFIPGRSIIENTLMAQEMVKGYNHSSLSARCALKLELQKAFDYVDWKFLLIVMEALDMPERMIAWIKECITTASYSVSLNGGLILDKAIEHGVFSFHPKCHRVKLTNLCFADDLLVFSKGTVGSIIGVWESGKLPVRYLGIPLVTKRLSVRDCSPLIEKVEATLQSWQAKMLSYAGRLLLIQAVFYSIVNYWGSQVLFPEAVLKKVNQLCSPFFWKGGQSGQGCEGQMGTDLHPKSEGGLGLKDLRVWNFACMIGLIRKLLLKDGSI